MADSSKRTSPIHTPKGSPQPIRDRTPRRIGLWTEYFSGDGTPYYHNSRTGVTCWEAPIEFVSQTSNSHVIASSGVDKGPRGSNVFVFGLPEIWTDDDLNRQFGKFGLIVSSRVITDRVTGSKRGYGFVSFDNPQSADECVACMHGFKFNNGKRLRVQIKKGDTVAD